MTNERYFLIHMTTPSFCIGLLFVLNKVKPFRPGIEDAQFILTLRMLRWIIFKYDVAEYKASFSTVMREAFNDLSHVKIFQLRINYFNIDRSEC